MPRRCAILAALLLAGLGALPGTASAADRAFAQRFQTHTRGNIAMAANSLLTCPDSAPTCASARAGSGSSADLDNNDWAMTNVDVDGDPTTFNSSSADLSIPAGATVKFAGLYWGADSSAGAGGAAAPAPGFENTLLLKSPGAAAYTPVTGAVDWSTSWPSRYAGFADVTAQVASGGAGTYTAANVEAGTGGDRYGGWSLVVVYQSPGEPVRDLSIYDGLVTVASGTTNTVTLDGIETPASGTVHGNLDVVSWESELGLTGDGAKLNGSTLSDAAHPATNFFNSSISAGGTAVTSKSPNYANQLGFDADTVGVDGLIAPGSTSATLQLSSTGDTYFAGVIALATDRPPEPPVNGSAPSLAGTLEDGHTLSADPGVWSGTQDISYAYQWQRCDAGGSNCVDIPGATGSTYDADASDVAHTVEVVVTATNSEGTATAYSSASGLVQPAPPSATSPASVSGSALDGHTLSANDGGWSGTGPLDPSYQWQRCDADGTNCVDIPGATASTYHLGAGDIGHTIVVVVTQTNVAGSDTSTSSPSAEVQPAPPTSTSPPLVGGGSHVGDTLSAGDGGWSGTGPLDASYQWQRCDADGMNCVDIPGATGPTYELTPEDVGHTIVVVVTDSNGAGSATSSSAPTPVIAAAPSQGDAGQIAGGGSQSHAGTPQAPPDLDLASLGWSRLTDQGCLRASGARVLTFHVAGAGRFRIRVAPNGTVSERRPLRARALVSARGRWILQRNLRRVTYRLGGRRLRSSARAPYLLVVPPARLARHPRQTLVVRVVPLHGKARVAKLTLTTAACPDLFSVIHRPSPRGSLLGLRVDTRKALHSVTFRVPARLLAPSRARGWAGAIRLGVSGQRPMNWRLVFPRVRAGAARVLSAGAGAPAVTLGRRTVTVTGLPARTGIVQLKLRGRAMKWTPRAVLRAILRTDGGTRRLTQRFRAHRAAPSPS
jgi:hypothetical protein